MPLLDVSSVLSDPDFATTAMLRRSSAVVGSKGRPSPASADVCFTAVITPDRIATLQRLAEGSNVAGSITVITRTRLRSSREAVEADEVIWHGNVYTVMSVADLSHYGNGFIRASCELKGPAS